VKSLLANLMCLVVVLWRVVADAPLIIAANREEAYDRPGTPPQLVENGVRFVAGLDPKAGGTWFGVNEYGVAVAVTNGPRSQPPAQPRSRGLLVRDLLGSKSAAEAAAHAAQELDTQRYAGCNLVCGDPDSLHVLHAGDWLRSLPLPPGIHVLTTGLVNNGADRRIAHSMAWLREQPHQTAKAWVPALQQLCSQTGDAEFPAMSVHGEGRGTVSSSILVLRRPVSSGDLWHAQGPPDKTAYEDMSPLLAHLS
jgi:uncharacterized protein with NRDE domain